MGLSHDGLARLGRSLCHHIRNLYRMRLMSDFTVPGQYVSDTLNLYSPAFSTFTPYQASASGSTRSTPDNLFSKY